MLVSPRRGLAMLLASAVLAIAPAASAKSPWIGNYRAAEGPDVVAGLELGADGHFRYGMSAGALDEQAEGSWREDGAVVRLTTMPKPRPATFAPAPSVAAASPGGLRVSVTWPNGRGIAGVDFKIGFAQGEPVQDYTQEYGWDHEEKRQPLWIELYEPIHGVASPRFAAAPGQHAFGFVLTPNDLGTLDLTDAVFERTDKGFVLHHPRGELHMVPDAKSSE